MFKTIIRASFFAFISIVIISISLAGWTSYTFFFQSSKSSEITNVIQDMYSKQKSAFVDVIDLTKILIKNTSKNKANEDNLTSFNKEFRTDLEDDSQLNELSMTEDNGNNPLGIVIETTLPGLIDESLPDSSQESLNKDEKDDYQ
tara:strand:- start:346 stop:780 length:435 start_codon:yes stop_codon:yes gene_type:complete